MLATAATDSTLARPTLNARANGAARPIAERPAPRAWAATDAQLAGERIAETLKLLQEKLPILRSVVHAGDTVYQAGERFACLHCRRR